MLLNLDGVDTIFDDETKADLVYNIYQILLKYLSNFKIIFDLLEMEARSWRNIQVFYLQIFPFCEQYSLWSSKKNNRLISKKSLQLAE